MNRKEGPVHSSRPFLRTSGQLYQHGGSLKKELIRISMKDNNSMQFSISQLVLAAGLNSLVLAAPQPEVTARAILPRYNPQTLGWYSSFITSGSTAYDDWIYDADRLTYTTSSKWFRGCPATSSCSVFYTGCSDGYLVADSTSLYCGAGGASGSLFCSNHVLLPTKGDPASSAMSWYWCDEAPLTGITLFATLPADAYILTPGSFSNPFFSTPSPSPSLTSTPSSTTDMSSSSISTAPGASSTLPASSPPVEKKSIIGPVVGGVVGGVAVLVAIAVGIFFLLRRHKKPPPTTPIVAQQWNPQSPQSPPPQMVYTPQSPKSPAVASPYAQTQGQKPESNISYYPLGVGQNTYPKGPYDPHMSQSYAESPPPPLQSYIGSPSPSQMHGSPQPQQGTVFGGELPALV
ncbi:hypothetical protein K504DRAFT_459371 [Pleomassaria siparia CBS 279.74]|uniref:Uncharacterized protein n=1 Tax=Pleomassaria siparia CBS 279.74 TaxID=1314801 RepID=A0A6G1K2A9_9PLEO|nr:hypothetical protein K504DRAFT_459371 [Pleomassaria siparia CBS 279.74]